MAELMEIKRIAKNLLDNRDLGVLIEHLKSDALLALTQGPMDDAESGLRNYRAIEVLEQSIKALAE